MKESRAGIWEEKHFQLSDCEGTQKRIGGLDSPITIVGDFNNFQKSVLARHRQSLVHKTHPQQTSTELSHEIRPPLRCIPRGRHMWRKQNQK